MWQWLMDVLPDWPIVLEWLPDWHWWDSLTRAERISVTDAGVSALALLAVAITAAVAVRLANRQMDMMHEQTEISRRQEAIAIQQADIAKTQHKIMQEQLGKQEILSVVLVLAKQESNVRGFTTAIVNNGNKTSYACYWYLLIPSERQQEVVFQAPETAVPHYGSIDGTNHLYYQGYSNKPLFPGRSTTFGTLDVLTSRLSGPIELKWHLVAEDGQFPKGKEYGTFKISASGDVVS